jgi:hypothetical protein
MRRVASIPGREAEAGEPRGAERTAGRMGSGMRYCVWNEATKKFSLV